MYFIDQIDNRYWLVQWLELILNPTTTCRKHWPGRPHSPWVLPLKAVRAYSPSLSKGCCHSSRSLGSHSSSNMGSVSEQAAQYEVGCPANWGPSCAVHGWQWPLPAWQCSISIFFIFSLRKCPTSSVIIFFRNLTFIFICADTFY